MEDLQVKVIDALIAYAFYNKNGVIAYDTMQKQVAQTLEEYWQE